MVRRKLFPAANLVICPLVALLCYLWMQPVRPATVAAQPKGEPASIRGELIYVPIYSSIFYENNKDVLELAATLSIHNVNPDRPLTILRADYYDTSGKLIRKHLDKPLTLSALETKNMVVDRKDTKGGPGANFLVEWQGAPDAVGPIVEAVMVNTSSNLGIAFTTTGKVIRQTSPTAK
jgi:hypothetical protein